jgi:hypothetical protein
MFILTISEKVAITGSIEELGNWNPTNAIFFTQQGKLNKVAKVYYVRKTYSLKSSY